MNLKTFYKVIILAFFIFINKNAIAAENYTRACPEKVTFIYIHGIDEPDIKVFERETDGQHRYFKGKRLGEYIIADDFRRVFWGDLPITELPFKLHSEGLKSMNMDHNVWKVKDTTNPKISLILNPFYRIFLIGDMGSKSNAVFFRNFINNYVYQLVWTSHDVIREQKIYNLIQKQINTVDGKYVLVGHSLGSAIALRFVMDRIIMDKNDPKYNEKTCQNFVGLITGGDVNNTFQAIRWSRDVCIDNYENNNKNLIKYFVKNGKFWISYNHRNDLFATKLPPELSYHNWEGPGFITSEVKKAYPFEGIVSFVTFWDKSNGIFLSHLYMLDKPKSFANNVLKVYNKESRSKKQIKNKCSMN